MKLAIFHESAGQHAEAQQMAREILQINPRLTAEIVVGAPFGLEEGARRRVELLQRAGLP